LAKSFYIKAAKAGKAEAYIKLGEFCVEERENSQALKMYLAGAMQGNDEAVEKLKAFAAQKNNTAQYYLGLIFEQRQQWQQAQEWYEGSILITGEDQYVIAMHRLGQLYQIDRRSSTDEIIIQKDITKTLEWYQKGIEQGCAHSLNALIELAKTELYAAELLAQMCVDGKGCITKNLKKAIKYYEQASELGSTEANYQLGICYEKASDIPDHSIQAFHSYSVAAKKDHQQALPALEKLVQTVQQVSLMIDLAELYYRAFSHIEKATQWYKKAIDRDEAAALSKLNQIAVEDAGFAYRFAKLYESENLQRATIYYAIARRQGHHEATTQLQILLEKDSAEAQYAVAYEYHHPRGELLEAAKLCMQAAEQNNPLAKRYLKNTPFSVEVCLTIASLYEEGKLVKKNMEQAFDFYIRASDLGNTDAAFHLGDLYRNDQLGVKKDLKKSLHYYKRASDLGSVEAAYQAGLCYEEDPNEADNFTKAFDYYLIAAKQKHEKALAALTRLTEESQNAKFAYQLAEFYYQNRNEIQLAAKWHKQAIDHGSAIAKSKLPQRINSNADFAYSVAQLYETDDRQQAMIYYAAAVRNGHQAANEYLQSQIAEGNADAQYALAVEYHKQGRVLEAITLCLKAIAQLHSLATHHLLTTTFKATICMQIASLCEQGTEVPKNMPFAEKFYLKASDQGNTKAHFQLGQFYQVEHVGVCQDLEKSFNHYLQAAKAGDQAALAPLERLAEEMDADKQVALGDLYCSPFTDIEKAKHWYQQAAEVDNGTAKQKLRDIEQQENRNSYRR